MRPAKATLILALIAFLVVVLAIVNRPGASPSGSQQPRTMATSLPSVPVTPGAPAPSLDQHRDWALAVLSAPALWAVTRGGGVMVAVVDTGVDTSQPDLVGVVQGNAPPDQSRDSHGTAIAGLIAGRGPADDPGQHVVGLAPQAQLVDIQVVAQPDAATAAEIAGGIHQAALSGARVINVSLGVPRDEGHVISKAVAFARGRDCLVVASAGGGSALQYPAASPGVLAVGGTTQAGSPLTSLSGYPHRAVYAPGANLYSTAELSPAGGGHDGYISPLSGNGYATAYVSAAAALILSAHPQLTADELRTYLVRSVSRVPGTSGFGIIDPSAVLGELSSLGQPTVTAAPSSAVPATATASASGQANAPVPASGSGLSRNEVLAGIAIVLVLGLLLLLFVSGGRPGPPRERRVEYTASTWEGW